jgi:hypothetical protein
VLAHFGVNSKILFGSLTDLSALVGFCTSSPQQGVKYQLQYLDLGGGIYKYTMKNSKHQSSCSLGVQIKGIAQTLN